ncbi:E3 ubiquitin-protein ligase HERC2 isoform X1 [Pan paniscus]|uniref:E3 ubiquitin-protein ligase HERC2 isoform X1 n=1 Tax=Pan paniscus TaxID=9597 RepID=UPI0015618269|nr:E3 ubiquitin-protein ligase HERC2 isoform X1 [Pan paniscus]
MKIILDLLQMIVSNQVEQRKKIWMTERKKMKLLHLYMGPSQFWRAGYGVSNQGCSRNARHQRAGSIPLQDQHLALAILLELAVQRGTLSCGTVGHRRLTMSVLPKAPAPRFCPCCKGSRASFAVRIHPTLRTTCTLKQTVVTLASSTDVLSTVQSASQAMLQSGWSMLLPTAEKQARALSALLPCGVSGNEVNISRGRRFVIDLLVGSLMAAGGLESALHAAITAEIQDIEAKKEAQKEKEIDEQEANASTFHRRRTPLDKDLINTGICESSGKQCLPLVQLIQ